MYVASFESKFSTTFKFVSFLDLYAAESFKNMLHIYTGYGRDYDVDYMQKTILDYKPNIFVIETGERFLDRLLNLNLPKE